MVVKKSGEYYLTNKIVLKEKAKNKYKSLSREEKKAKREYQRNKNRSMKEKISQMSVKET